MSYRPALRQRDGNRTNLQVSVKSIRKKDAEKDNSTTKALSSRITHFRKNDQNSETTTKVPLASHIQSLRENSIDDNKSLKSTKFKIFQDKKINKFGKELHTINNKNNDEHVSKKKKIHEFNQLYTLNDSTESMNDEYSGNNHEYFQNFKFELDPSLSDPTSLLYKCQMPLIRLNDWYNITQFSITSNSEYIDHGSIYEITEIHSFNELIKSVVIHKISSSQSPPTQILLIAQKQSISNFKKFQKLKIGNLIELNDDAEENESIKSYYNWRLIQ